MSSFYANNFDREFQVALILGSIDAVPIWNPGYWPKLIGALGPLVNVARGEAGAQWGYTERFGERLKFVERTSQSWHDPPASDGVFQIWNLLAPSDQVCVAEQRCPDLYVSIRNKRGLPASRAKFGTYVLIAVGADVPSADNLLHLAGERIAASVSAVMFARKRRPWGFASETGYNGGISETQWFVGGPLDREPSEDILCEEWEHVVVSKPPK